MRSLKPRFPRKRLWKVTELQCESKPPASEFVSLTSFCSGKGTLPRGPGRACSSWPTFWTEGHGSLTPSVSLFWWLRPGELSPSPQPGGVDRLAWHKRADPGLRGQPPARPVRHDDESYAPNLVKSWLKSHFVKQGPYLLSLRCCDDSSWKCIAVEAPQRRSRRETFRQHLRWLIIT